MGQEANSGISRRSFLGGSALALGAAALAGMTGCAAGETKQAEPTSVGSADGECSYQVYDTDVIVIGSGIASMPAAMVAQDSGASVMIVDKAQFGHSGGSGFNWGIISAYLDDGADLDMIKRYCSVYMGGVGNQSNINAAIDEWMDLRLDADCLKAGNSAYQRNDAGSVQVAPYPPGVTMLYGVFSRHYADTVQRKPIQILDHTMVTDFLIQDGVCVGVVGYDVHTGAFRVIRGKVTVCGGGPYHAFYGWRSVHAQSINSPDNTGDLDAAAMRHGLTFVNMEFFYGDLMNIYPPSVAASCNGGIAADMLEYKYVVDKDGNAFMADIPAEEMTQFRVNYEVAKMVAEGKGSPNGGAYVKFSSPEVLEIIKTREVYYRNVEAWKRMFGIDILNDEIEIATEIYDGFGHPLIDGTWSTEIPGLYWVNGGGFAGRMNDSALIISASRIAGRNAVAYAESVEPAEFDWSLAQAEFDRLEGIRTFAAEGSKAPFEVRHAIQATCHDNLGVMRSGEGLEACIAELERIRDEELPKMAVRNSSKQYNTDWRCAVENYNLLDMALGCAKAALMREESRNMHARTDFPDTDNENWLCQVAVKKEDGVISAEKRDLEITEISLEEIKANMELGLGGVIGGV